MNKKILCLAAALLLMATAAKAQNDEGSVSFKSMLSATAKVMFIDSVVVDKEHFLRHIPLNAESGTIDDARFAAGEFTNELGDQRYFADGDTTNGTHLFFTQQLAGQWSQPKQLEGIDNGYKDAAFPFLMPDGVTLFFAAKGSASIGGYDIFMTLLDSESGTFYKPENYGLPFNSTANDYLVAFDEMDSLGWLVSDRYQPAGKVCIYTFVPTVPRQGFENDNLSPERLESYARLRSIKDTWRFGKRKQALNRLAEMKKRGGSQAVTSGKQWARFVVNDRTVYDNEQQFQSPENRTQYKKYVQLAEQTEQDLRQLQQLRDLYGKSKKQGDLKLASDILQLEDRVIVNQQEMKALEKEIRQRENFVLNN